MRRSRLPALRAAPLLALLLAGCPGAGGPEVTLAGRHFAVEVVSDDASRERGLMFRDTMENDHGMLFVYPDSRPVAFWMKNTHLPLDILYFDETGHFVSAHYGVPPCLGDPCPNYPSNGPARYVLELNAGVGKALKLERGAALTLPAQ